MNNRKLNENSHILQDQTKNSTEIIQSKYSLFISDQQNIFLTHKSLFRYIFLTSIIMIVQYYYIPFLYGNLLLQRDYYQFVLIICTISFLLGMFQFVKGLEYENLFNQQLKRLSIISSKIIVYFESSKKIQSFENLLSCRKRIDILECYAINPKQFLNDYLECIKQNINSQMNCVYSKYNNQIINLIDPLKYKTLLNMYPNNLNNSEWKFFYEKLKISQLNDIMQQSVIKEGNIIDYYQFINNLQEVEKTQKNIKIKILNSEGNNELREFKNIDNSNLQINNKNSISNKKKSKSQFETTMISDLIDNINSKNDQDINMDNVLREQQYEKMDTKVIDVKRIHDYIQDLEGIKCISNQDYTSSLIYENQNITMYIKFADDKTIENIGKKVQRKNDLLIPNNIPQCIKLIKDWKRMSIVFNNEREIFLFMKNKQKLFGIDQSQEVQFEEQKILIRIQEIKNGFYNLELELESGDQRDIKIIQEVLVIDLDFAFFIECQLNLENLIIFKKVDHDIQDFNRAKDVFETVKKQQERYEQMEGKTRMILYSIRIISLLIAIASIGISLGIVLNDINKRLITIQHANYNIIVKFLEGNYPNNICQSFDNSQVNCVGYSKISKLIQNISLTKFKKLKSNGESLIGINNKSNIFIQNLLDQQDLSSNEYINDIKQNNKLICQSTKKNILCNHKQMYPKIVSAQFNSLCISVENKIECFGDTDTKLKVIPIGIRNGADLLVAGKEVNCASTKYIFTCWGTNPSGLLDIPDQFSKEVDLLAVGSSNVCAGKTNQVICWGYDITANGVYQTTSLNDIPSQIAKGADVIRISSFNACASSNVQFVCWGINTFGLNDIPSEFSSVSVFALSDQNVCAFNLVFNCWGLDLHDIFIFPRLYQSISIIVMNYDQRCISNEEVFECWGDRLLFIFSLNPYNKFINIFETGVDQLAIGHEFICMTKNQHFVLQGKMNVQPEIDTILTWNLPSIQFETTNVNHCNEIICINKGKLICYYQHITGYQLSLEIPDDMIQTNNFLSSESFIICSINNIGKFSCAKFNNSLDDVTVPSAFTFGTLHQSIGDGYVCASTKDLIDCWGMNQQGAVDIPTIHSEVLTLSSGDQATCASTQFRLYCWGGFFLYNNESEQEWNTIPSIPANLKDGVDQVELGIQFICAIKNKQLFCFGFNQNGPLDIPDQFNHGNIDILSVGWYHVCAQINDNLSCWGYQGDVDRYGEVPKQLRSGARMINSCASNICALYQTEWVCWGEYGIPMRLNVTGQFQQSNVTKFDLTQDYDICIQYQDQIECKSDSYNNDRQSFDIVVSESLLCMQNQLNKPQICQVDNQNKSSFKCVSGQQILSEGIGLEQKGDSTIVKLTCGTNHGCALFQSGEVHCLGGYEEFNEATLTNDMKEGVYDIRAGFNSTCVLKSNKIICNGKRIESKLDDFNLETLQGFDQIIKFN